MSLNFKTIVEVKVMHEYFLTSTEGKSPFGLPDQGDRMTFLQDEFRSGSESLSRFLRFDFPEELKSAYDSYGLRVIPSFSGFRIVQRVQAKLLSSGDRVFKPETALPENFTIHVLIWKTNDRLTDLTHGRMARPFESRYFFSNDNSTQPGQFPFLTRPVPAFDSTIDYEQGELASFSGNQLQRFYRDGTGALWYPIEGFTFANEADQVLSPFRIKYRTVGLPLPNQLKATLQDSNGQELKSITASDARGIQKMTLDFSDLAGVLLPQDGNISQLNTLVVTGNGGFNREHPIRFSNFSLDDSVWGLCAIKITTSNPSFDLYDLNGYIKKRRLSDGTEVPAPLFEISILSKFTYWRYLNDKGRKLKFTSDHTDYLFQDGPALMTLQPHPLTQFWFKLLKPDRTQPQYFPNPYLPDLKQDDNKRVYVEVSVPESKLFPIMP